MNIDQIIKWVVAAAVCIGLVGTACAAFLSTPRNLPARKRWGWVGLALVNAVATAGLIWLVA